jgi:hypothetical protein
MPFTAGMQLPWPGMGARANSYLFSYLGSTAPFYPSRIRDITP